MIIDIPNIAFPALYSDNQTNKPSDGRLVIPVLERLLTECLSDSSAIASGLLLEAGQPNWLKTIAKISLPSPIYMRDRVPRRKVTNKLQKSAAEKSNQLKTPYHTRD